MIYSRHGNQFSDIGQSLVNEPIETTIGLFGITLFKHSDRYRKHLWAFRYFDKLSNHKLNDRVLQDVSVAEPVEASKRPQKRANDDGGFDKLNHRRRILSLSQRQRREIGKYSLTLLVKEYPLLVAFS